MTRRLPALFAVSLMLACVASAAIATSEAPAKKATAAKADPEMVAAGAKLYAQYCATCHGKTGLGDGAGAKTLNPKPRNLRDPKALKSKNDDDLYKVISKGGAALGLSNAMVGWGGILKEPQVRQLVAFVRSLAETPAAEKAAKSR